VSDIVSMKTPTPSHFSVIIPNRQHTQLLL